MVQSNRTICNVVVSTLYNAINTNNLYWESSSVAGAKIPLQISSSPKGFRRCVKHFGHQCRCAMLGIAFGPPQFDADCFTALTRCGTLSHAVRPGDRAKVGPSPASLLGPGRCSAHPHAPDRQPGVVAWTAREPRRTSAGRQSIGHYRA